jgi:hypothetical protein
MEKALLPCTPKAFLQKIYIEKWLKAENTTSQRRKIPLAKEEYLYLLPDS